MIEQYDIITVQNKDYAVASQLMYNGSEYMLLVEVDQREEPVGSQMIVEKVNSQNGYGIKDIEDDKLYKEVKERLINIMYNE